MLPLVIRGIAWPRNGTLLELAFVLYDLPKGGRFAKPGDSVERGKCVTV